MSAVPQSANADSADLVAARAALGDAMKRQSLLPLWEVYEKVVTQEPSADAPSHLWRWRDLAEPVALTTRTVMGRDADHRVLVLKNPHYPHRVATANNILGAVQCVLPGEKTPPHRHTPAAVRIVLEGAGGGTFVDGVRCEMHTGDFIATPNWTWHCHENDSSTPITWVDILDVPLVRAANAVFGDLGPVDAYPAAPTSRFRYSWEDVQAQLAQMPADSDGSRAVRYVDPITGRPPVPTLDAQMLELAPDRSTRMLRTSASGLVVVIEGEGTSRVGGVTHEWRRGDVFTVPEWNWVAHEAHGARARLLVVTDRCVRELLNLYREERQ